MDDQRPTGPEGHPSSATHVVVMGVSGSVTSTIAVGLARRLRWEFGEGDAFHSAANVEKMATGTPTRTVGPGCNAWPGGSPTTMRPNVLGARLLGPASRIPGRAPERCGQGPPRPPHRARRRCSPSGWGDRDGHVMPGSLLHSQLATLEALQPDEDGLVLDVRGDPVALGDTVVRRLE